MRSVFHNQKFCSCTISIRIVSFCPMKNDRSHVHFVLSVRTASLRRWMYHIIRCMATCYVIISSCSVRGKLPQCVSAAELPSSIMFSVVSLRPVHRQRRKLVRSVRRAGSDQKSGSRSGFVAGLCVFYRASAASAVTQCSSDLTLRRSLWRSPGRLSGPVGRYLLGVWSEASQSCSRAAL